MSGSLRRCAEAVSNRPGVFVSGVTLAVVALGLVNVLTAARQASADPELADLRILVDWLQSAEPYARFEDTSLQVDYPPHARLVLFPLTVVPWDTLRLLWPWLSVACLVVAGWVLWRDHRRLLLMTALLVVAATAGAAWHFHTSPWAAVVGQVWGAHVASRLVAVTAIAAGGVAVSLAWRRPRQPIAGIITTWTAGLLWLPHGPYQLGLCLPVAWLVAFAPDAVGLTPWRARVLAGLLVWLLVSNLPAGWESPLWPLPLEKALSDVPIHSLADECIRVPILACHVLAVRRLWRPASTSS